MLRYLRHVGGRRALRYLLLSPFVEAACALPWAPARAAALRALGGRIGAAVWIERVRLWNVYTNGAANLEIGPGAYVGPEALIDLANPVRIGARAILGPRVTIVTHVSVGLPDHSLAARLPRRDAPVEVGEGAFVGAGTLLLAGARVGAGEVIPAGSVLKGRPPG